MSASKAISSRKKGQMQQGTATPLTPAVLQTGNDKQERKIGDHCLNGEPASHNKLHRGNYVRAISMGVGLLAVSLACFALLDSPLAVQVAQGTCDALQQHRDASGGLVAGFQPRRSLFAALWNATMPAGRKANRRVTPARGIYPKGCKWRDVSYAGEKTGFWSVVEYEFYDNAKRQWTTQMPASCVVEGIKNPKGYSWSGGSPRSEASCTDTYCIYNNLWYNNGKFYLLVDGPNEVAGWTMTRNQDLHVLHVHDARAFVDSVQTRVVPGDTLIFDFIYFLHPTAIGHWCEVMFPLFSILKQQANFSRPATQFVLLHLKRIHLMEWVRAVVATALGVPSNGDLPPLIMQQETDNIWKQIPQPLEGYGSGEWVSFERALVVRDIFTGGVRTFFSHEDAREFRSEIYQQYGLPPPAPRLVPRTITFQRKRANRRIINEEQFIKTLEEFGEVRVVEFNASTSFKEQLEVISSTGVYISVHTSNLANAPFLQPGSVVIELLQKNWIWHNLDRNFLVQTESMGDIHHYAWRARHRNQTVYVNKRDAERFADWPPRLCDTEECVEAHTNVDVVVNLQELRELLQDRLPVVFAGTPVPDAKLPWPEPEAASSITAEGEELGQYEALPHRKAEEAAAKAAMEAAAAAAARDAGAHGAEGTAAEADG